ncbi:hypothetical protein RKD29_007881 [Streptomyces tendae]
MLADGAVVVGGLSRTAVRVVGEQEAGRATSAAGGERQQGAARRAS